MSAVSRDYRSILKEEFAARTRQNSRYSLRAFARDLGLSPSRLSEIFNGKQGLSRESAERIADTLGFASFEKEHFCDLVASLHARSKKERELALIRLKKHAAPSKTHQLQLDAFKVIADWYHLAIMELTLVSGFQSEPRWIARTLKISEVEVKLAIERLERLGLIAWEKGKLTPQHADGDVLGDVPSESIKKFQSQIMEKAKKAIFTQTLEQREFRSTILAMDRKKLKAAKKALRDFENRFCIDLGGANRKDALYCLAIQFFELAQGELP